MRKLSDTAMATLRAVVESAATEYAYALFVTSDGEESEERIRPDAVLMGVAVEGPDMGAPFVRVRWCGIEIASCVGSVPDEAVTALAAWAEVVAVVTGQLHTRMREVYAHAHAHEQHKAALRAMAKAVREGKQSAYPPPPDTDADADADGLLSVAALTRSRPN
jgi:hypothetical protein